MDGFDVMDMLDASKVGDVFITVTGNTKVMERALYENERRSSALQCRPL